MKVKFLIPLLVLFAACNTVNVPLTDAQKEAVKGEAKEVVDVLINAMTENKLDLFLDLMENSPDFTMSVAGEVYDFKGILEMIDQVSPMMERQTFETKFEQYVVIDMNCFLYLWKGKNGVYMKSGESVVYDDYVFTYGFRKTEGSWKMFFGHESYLAPLPFDLDQDQDEDID